MLQKFNIYTELFFKWLLNTAVQTQKWTMNNNNNKNNNNNVKYISYLIIK